MGGAEEEARESLRKEREDGRKELTVIATF
jgi:hypothetical protein